NEIKMAPVFAPDSSRVVYSVGISSSFSVPVAGGQPALLMRNAGGLRWVGPGRVLFSEIASGFHMGLVTATESRGEPRKVYFPESNQGMVHFSEPSPDGRWVLAVEMLRAVWQPCRLVPFDGSSAGKQVGPARGLCTAAAWSPDGRWMYFAAEVDAEYHLWRQRFPDGLAEQITSGLNQEWSVAADPDGRSLIAAAGNSQSTVWYHDESGDRPVSVEGYAYRPLVSPDGGVDEQRPFFSPSGDIYFTQRALHGRILFRMKPDGSARRSLSSESDAYLVNILPDEKWAVIWEGSGGVAFWPLAGGSPQ